jgi:hypothetical protein
MISVALSIGDIAKEATKIPFAIFTNLFHHRFQKKVISGINVGTIAAVLHPT